MRPRCCNCRARQRSTASRISPLITFGFCCLSSKRLRSSSLKRGTSSWMSMRSSKGPGRVAFLPYVRTTLKSLIPKPWEFEPKTLGEHIKRRRLELGLEQKDVAKQLGVTTDTVLNWEKGYNH